MIKEFSVDEKGAVLVAGFGLPPRIGENPAVRACLAALDISSRLESLNYATACGE